MTKGCKFCGHRSSSKRYMVEHVYYRHRTLELFTRMAEECKKNGFWGPGSLDSKAVERYYKEITEMLQGERP